MADFPFDKGLGVRMLGLEVKKLFKTYQVISNQKRDSFFRLYDKTSYLEIRKSNFCVLYVKKFTTFCSFRIYICCLKDCFLLVLTVSIMLKHVLS